MTGVFVKGIPIGIWVLPAGSASREPFVFRGGGVEREVHRLAGAELSAETFADPGAIGPRIAPVDADDGVYRLVEGRPIVA